MSMGNVLVAVRKVGASDEGAVPVGALVVSTCIIVVFDGIRVAFVVALDPTMM